MDGEEEAKVNKLPVAKKKKKSKEKMIEIDADKLDKLISSTLNKLCSAEFNDFGDDEDDKELQEEYNKLVQNMKANERKHREVTKIYMECSDKLSLFREELEKADREEELKEAAAEIDAREAAEANARVDAGESDDDVQIVSATFDPKVAEKRQTLQKSPADKQALPQRTPAESNTNPSPLQTYRQMFTNSINRQLAPQQTAPPPQALGVQNKAKISQQYNIEIQAVAVGSKVIGKKFNDIWYCGTVAEIQHADQSIQERKYNIKFDGKGKKLLGSKHVALRDSLPRPVPVGTRVIALYKDEESSSSFYAGIIAETPNSRNRQRYLVFFDDGYAQYSTDKDIHKVFFQETCVWEDIPADSQEFVKEYLKQYPERPMVRLYQHQVVKTEWMGKWWTAKVIEVDASLVKMYFLADDRVEWIYRGSTRLEPLYTYLANAQQGKISGKVRRNALDAKGGKKNLVEYNRDTDEKNNVQKNPAQQSQVGYQVHMKQPFTGTEKKRPVARKSTASRSNSTDSRKSHSMGEGYAACSMSAQKETKDIASVLQERLARPSPDLDEDAMGERRESKLGIDRIKARYNVHLCGPHCLRNADDDAEKYSGRNPLIIPSLCGWERQVCKMKPSNKRVVNYRGPCGRRLRTFDDLDHYLMLTQSKLTIDLFCYDPNLHVHTEFVPVKTFCDIKDLSYGKENVPISCVNAIDRNYPDYVEYSNVRIPGKGVNLNLDPEFLTCCSCTDNCRDKTKCECQQLTAEASAVIDGGKKNLNAGYEHRRLKDPAVYGVYECNPMCNCEKTCYNRVVQEGLKCRLQVFKTQKKGWGLRCLDDLPAGGFICIYAGQLLTEQGANEDGQQYGDEYLAELDYIEVVERLKEGYESDVDDDEGLGQDDDEEDEKDDDDDDEDDDHQTESDCDSDFSGEKVNVAPGYNPHHTRNRAKSTGSGDQKLQKLVLRRDSAGKPTQGKGEWSAERGSSSEKSVSQVSEKESKKKDTLDWVNSSDLITIDDDDEDEEGGDNESETSASKSANKVKNEFQDSDSLADSDVSTRKKSNEKDKEYAEPSRQVSTARRSTSKTSRFKNLPDPKKKLPVEETINEEEVPPSQKGTRKYFKDNQDCYIMDAKSMGNIGRYLNHSCSPNVFVQNVFVDTHDLRFPWVTFFAGQYIRAGTELTWDYNYEVGSVPNKVLYCYCGSAECRGRLL